MLIPKAHPQLLHVDDTILVVVDMQEPFLQVMHERERLIRNVSILIKGAKVMRLPIIGTTQNRKALGSVIPEISELFSPLRPPFDKLVFNCNADTAFASEVNRSGRKQIIICGLETHICVSQTALSLVASGYQVHVASDAVSSRNTDNWRIGLEKVRQGGGLITSVETALFELLHEAGTTEFREVLNLIK